MLNIKCNMCGKDFDLFDMQEHFSINRILGFGTKHDGCKLEMDICCECMDKLIESCKISPVREIPYRKAGCEQNEN